MSTIYGVLGLPNTTDSQYAFLRTFGQRAIYDAVNQYFAMQQADINATMALFVEETTSDYKRRYMLPGAGMMQRIGGQSQPAPIKPTGSWDVGLPLENFGDMIAISRVAFGYSTLADLQRQLTAIDQRNINTIRHEMLEALFNNAEDAFIDPDWGTLLVEPLANGDAVLYPPQLGASAEATENNYLFSGYASSTINDTNNPFPTLVEQLERHFGTPSGGSRIVTLINNAQTAAVSALTDFVPLTNRYIQVGLAADTVTDIPPEVAALSGRVIGTVSGSLVVEYRYIPADYMLSVHLDAPKPLIKRVDPTETGLNTGLTLVARSDVNPFTESVYENRYGFGVGNRLNGVFIRFDASAFAVPTGY